LRIGLPGAAPSIEQMIQRAQRAEADGFTSLWYTSDTADDPLVAIALAGRATSGIELGTGVLQTFTCHPVLQAARAAAVAAAFRVEGRFTLGIGPSHERFVSDSQGMPYTSPGNHTEEYVQILGALLSGQSASFAGRDFRVQAEPPQLPGGAGIPILVAALGPRLLRVAGQYTAGTILWLATARAIADHIAPRIRAAAAEHGRPEPRIVAGLPVAVHDDVDEARVAAADQMGWYGTLPNYQRVLSLGGVPDPAAAAVVGNEASVVAQVKRLFDAGSTDVRLRPFPVGPDATASLARTYALLTVLARM